MPESEEPGRPRRYCTNCGAEAAPGGAFCPSCGTRLGGAGGGADEAGPTPRAAGDAPKGGRGRPALLAAVALLLLALAVAVVVAYPREPGYEVVYRRDISELLQTASGNDYGDTGVLDEEGTALYLQVRVQDRDDVPAVEDRISSDFPAHDCVAIDYYGQGGGGPIEASYLGDQACGDDIELIEDFAGPLGRT